MTSGGTTSSGSTSAGGTGGSGGGMDAGLADAGESVDAGAIGRPAILCSPQGIDFGLNAVGVSSTLSTLCTNIGESVPGHPETNLFIPDPSSGEAGLTIQNGDLAFQPAFDAPFPTIGLAAGETTKINVTYAPNATGSDNDVLIISSNDSVNPRTRVSLAGTANVLPPCEFSVTPNRVDLGDVNVGVEVTFDLSLNNLGTNECLVGTPVRFVNFPNSPEPGPPGAVIVLGDSSLTLRFLVVFTTAGFWEGEIDFTVSRPRPLKIPVTANVL